MTCFWQNELRTEERGCGGSALVAVWQEEVLVDNTPPPSNGIGYMDIVVSGGIAPYSVSLQNVPGRNDLSLLTVNASMISANVARVNMTTASFFISSEPNCVAIFNVVVTDSAAQSVNVPAPYSGVSGVPEFMVFNPAHNNSSYGTLYDDYPSWGGFGVSGGCN